MKFATKLFLTITAVLTIIFTAFGSWMMSSYFSKILDREMEQAEQENRIFYNLFDIVYNSMSEYGHEYGIRSAVDSAVSSVERDGKKCFIWSENEDYYGDTNRAYYQAEGAKALVQELTEEDTYISGIRLLEGEYYLLSVCKFQGLSECVYLGCSKDISSIYEDRQNLLNQYRLALTILLVVGAGCIYVLSYYLTRPIRELDRVVEKIAGGSLEERSDYESEDEIGTLATNLNHMADKLVEQMQEKEKQANEKERFTSAFAHELKTPLTAIIGYADMLNSVEMSEEECREAYYYIYRQGKRLESLSHKLLELASMEHTPLKIQAVPTKELEENIRKTMRPMFEKKNMKCRIVMEKGHLYGDRELLLSVFYNLLDNAVKAAGEDGFILFKGMALENGYEIKVVDNGCGIPEQDIEKITEAFYMVDKSRSRKEGGAGIGMTLCQRIITLHKGTMRISSKLGEGTVVQIFFPGREEMMES
ncbi:MAG: HAMP domain-containing histidine kinase [Lachnospiraceae bacterium]|nr:HAMP domain-containing histidine kinase [Lachnospiraceae bacterium]